MTDRSDEPCTSRDRPATPSPRRGLYGQRPSKSHDDLLRTEFARIATMSARERMIEALALDRELSPFPARKARSGPEGKPLSRPTTNGPEVNGPGHPPFLKTEEANVALIHRTGEMLHAVFDEAHRLGIKLNYTVVVTEGSSAQQ